MPEFLYPSFVHSIFFAASFFLQHQHQHKLFLRQKFFFLFLQVIYFHRFVFFCSGWKVCFQGISVQQFGESYMDKQASTTKKKVRGERVKVNHQGLFLNYDHTNGKAPDPVWSPQLNPLWPCQYYGGGPHGNTGCCSFFALISFIFFTHPVYNYELLLSGYVALMMQIVFLKVWVSRKGYNRYFFLQSSSFYDKMTYNVLIINFLAGNKGDKIRVIIGW